MTTTEETTAEGWRDKRMIRGRWRKPSESAAEPRADRSICVKLTEAELAELDGQCAVAGIKRNRALRIAARRIGGFLEPGSEVLDELRSVSRQIGGIARNVNQITRVANITHEADIRALREERQLLGQELARLDVLLRQVVDVGGRRSDGLKRLTKAADERAGG